MTYVALTTTGVFSGCIVTLSLQVKLLYNDRGSYTLCYARTYSDTHQSMCLEEVMQNVGTWTLDDAVKAGEQDMT